MATNQVCHPQHCSPGNVQAYSDLNNYDKLPLQMLEKYQAKILGCFKAKGQTVSPGLVATRRCNKQAKQQEKQVLEQCLPYQSPAPTAKEPVPPALSLASTLNVGGVGDRHRYHLPHTTAGSLPTVRQPAAPVPIPVIFVLPPASEACTPQPQALLLLTGMQPVHTAAPTSLQPSNMLAVPSTTVHRSTNWYRRKQQKKEAGEHVWINKRHMPIYSCGKCKKPRLKEVDGELAHTQLCGAWWCWEVDIPLPQWSRGRPQWTRKQGLNSRLSLQRLLQPLET
ncbi:uncharacterized protein LOC143294031 isoform X1 [Babylonia areolata]|uniref:uncharacterized protein LOC143294031 isoform X1 n=1 Tax=Babylonia areolata TaxID=304850 RepID=UPI003FD59BB2